MNRQLLACLCALLTSFPILAQNLEGTASINDTLFECRGRLKDAKDESVLMLNLSSNPPEVTTVINLSGFPDLPLALGQNGGVFVSSRQEPGDDDERVVTRYLFRMDASGRTFYYFNNSRIEPGHKARHSQFLQGKCTSLLMQETAG